MEMFRVYLRRYMRRERLTTEDIASGLQVTAKTVAEWLRGRGPRLSAAKGYRLRLETGREWFRRAKEDRP